MSKNNFVRTDEDFFRLKIGILFVLLFGLLSIFSLNKGKSFGSCLNFTGQEKIDCVRHQIDFFLAKKNVRQALNYLADYENRDKNFYATDCHGLAHYIGDKAFNFYKQGYQIDYGQNSNVCGYGFYHAFTSSFILVGEESQAKNFCLGLESKSMSSATSCYHGIGHGAVYDYFEDYRIRDPLAIINKAVKLCQSVLDADYKINECATGVYDGIGDEVLSPSYTGLTPTIIYGYCQSQPQKFKSSCYENISHLVFRKTLLGFSKLVDFVLQSPVVEDKNAAIGGLATIYVVDLKGVSIDPGIKICLGLKSDLKATCLHNMSSRLEGDALNGQAYEVAEEFCNSQLMNQDDKKVCFANAVQGLFSYYTGNTLLDRCKKDQNSFFRDVCLSQFN